MHNLVNGTKCVINVRDFKRSPYYDSRTVEKTLQSAGKVLLNCQYNDQKLTVVEFDTPVTYASGVPATHSVQYPQNSNTRLITRISRDTDIIISYTFCVVVPTSMVKAVETDTIKTESGVRARAYVDTIWNNKSFDAHIESIMKSNKPSCCIQNSSFEELVICGNSWT